MTTSTVAPLMPAIDVLATVMTRTSDNYQQLLHQPQSYAFCREAGRSLRCLSDRYARVLLAALDYSPDDVSGEEELLSDLESDSEE